MTTHNETISPANDDSTEPLLVTPSQAGKLLGFGKTSVFQLLSDGVLERRKIGKSTRITMRSIRKLAGV